MIFVDTSYLLPLANPRDSLYARAQAWASAIRDPWVLTDYVIWETMPADRIVIANCGGFWGDDPTAARRQVEGGPVDYLVMDYLAEVTMAILQKQRAKKPELG